MSNVVKFPGGRPEPPRFSLDASKARKAAGIVLAGLVFVLNIVRVPLFLVMMWLRLPVVFICNIISIPCLLIWLFSLYAFPEHHFMVRGFGIISFVSFVFAWLYDYILMVLSPQDMTKVI